MAANMRDGTPRPAGPGGLWGVSFAASTVFLASWALCWLRAYGLNDDLPNACDDVRRQVFPAEVACVSMDGTVTGGTPGWLVVLFFASLVVAVLSGTMALAVTAAVRGR
ncbi:MULTISPECIES: hypothetical protein [unclassified Streptomyces]|uniref:hypothetical protein n=1 Tax=unclassified Streptomyces TaxID=2593676 RepID=UPI0011B005F7|nr:hypothetical protein [Streptomyces sp. SM10]